MLENLILRDKSIIPSADDSHSELLQLVQATYDIDEVSGYKIGFGPGLQSLTEAVKRIAHFTNTKARIYDHQKGGNDIPDMGEKFAKTLKGCGIDGAILFPFTGPTTQERWTKSLQDAGIIVITGGHMTHEKFLESEGGYIADNAPERIYRLSARLGVRDFVVPGNKIEYVKKYRDILLDEIGDANFRLLSPGFIKQGGEISEFAKEAGDFWHAIIGRGLTESKNIRQTALELTKNLL